MFNQSVDQRLTEWINCRNTIDQTDDPLQYVWDFWHTAPFIPFNKNVDPFYQKSWPSPWEIIVDNRYDDFTRALMIAWTLKLTKKYANSKVEIRTLVDSVTEREYNLVYVDNEWIINYHDNGPILLKDFVGQFRLENLVEVSSPR